MATGSMETAIMSDPTIKLPDDLLVEIISRVPFKSTRCCKCVSTRWRDLISHPDHRDKLPRSTLAGFFCKNRGMDCDPRFHDVYHSVSGDWCPFDDSLSFLPEYEELDILDCCNGLLLCLCSQPYAEKPDYVVCNPATEKWVTFPANRIVSFARLGFDPAVSSHFHVFELVPINSKVDMIIGSKRWGSTLPKLEVGHIKLLGTIQLRYSTFQVAHFSAGCCIYLLIIIQLQPSMWREIVGSFLFLLLMMLLLFLMSMYHGDNCISQIGVLLNYQSGFLKTLVVKIVGP
ncbi:hypothetical protein VPH35_055173 [Triticum aestivum]|uniref:uncharacterized protein n=1 Tax=Triticum aestivum TaxID=4565 RepID=UPI001D03447B|nr:uncharacterized protein LOC123066353 [Triticum aestivum]XP_044345381.1 uncharacterized protein LOC123066353 [Triticum aestivum]